MPHTGHCPELAGAFQAEKERPFTVKALLFDDLVGAGEDRRWDRQPECCSGLEVDDQLELSRLLYR
jgi:hypothetical protein